ncbi:MAG: hypothetical protein JSV84_09210 [Gemmatimonadota bacterium]|nr:MAG: hypothetical protein JSV84_09210 [Gemmatimonadota bacterium]
MENKIIVLVLVFVFCLPISLLVQPYEGEKGDVNNDGIVDLIDVIEAVNIGLGLETPGNDVLWRADCNGFLGSCSGDGNVDLLDILKIVNIILEVDACPSTTVTDIDGNVYQTVIIGDQVWMAENLKVTHYRNGDAIPNVTKGSEWSDLSTGAFCNYNNDANNVPTYGRLYNWYAVDNSRHIAPEDWHVPTDEDWKQLEMYLGMSQSQADSIGLRGTDEGGKMKESGTSHWSSPNTGATNESGFTALPAGFRYYTIEVFGAMGGEAGFWSSTEYSSGYAFRRGLNSIDSKVYRRTSYMQNGFSIRCVKD